MEIVHFIPPSQRRLAMLAAQADTAPVLIFGSTGSGKNRIAQWIHRTGPRAACALVVTQKEESISSQIAKAQGGTCVVSEIGELPLGEQKILLSYLETKSLPHPSGNGMRMLTNTRIIATTSHALEGRAQGGLFNAELLKKLNVFRLEMPDLTERANEFEDIVEAILGEHTRDLHKEHVRDIAPEAWKIIRDYHWPGNLRELRNVLRVAVMTAPGDRIEVGDLPEFGVDKMDFRATREQFEKSYIEELLKKNNGEIDQTCRVNRINRDAFIAKIKKYGIAVTPTSPSGH